MNVTHLWGFILTNLVLFSCNRIDEIRNIEPKSSNFANVPIVQSTHDSILLLEEQVAIRYELCRCLVMNDSLTQLLEEIHDFETTYADQLLEQLEYVRNHCRSILRPVFPQSLEEQRRYIDSLQDCLQDTSLSDFHLHFFN